MRGREADSIERRTQNYARGENTLMRVHKTPQKARVTDVDPSDELVSKDDGLALADEWVEHHVEVKSSCPLREHNIASSSNMQDMCTFLKPIRKLW